MLGSQWHNSLYVSESASRRVQSSRRNQSDISGQRYLLRRIPGLKREALMMSLSGAELGKLTEGGFRPCQALQNYDSAGSSARVKQAPDPIRREPRATFDLEDPVQFQEDFRASRVIDSTWLHQGNIVQVTVRGGQAHQPSSIDKKDGSMASRARS